jgi:flagellar motor switch protein FliN/FliY
MLNELLQAWARELAQALEMMTGNAYRVAVNPASADAVERLWYSQSLGTEDWAFAVGVEEHVWNELGTRALQGAGIELIEPAEARSTWFEIVQQAISGAIRAVWRGQAAGAVAPGGPVDGPPSAVGWFVATVTTPDGLNLDLCISTSIPMEQVPSAEPPHKSPAAPAVLEPTNGAMDILLDVQLPISISFGQTQLRLKDVLKLTAGSVVELNRQPEEPVDLIVNDYIIARGEVVVVDGNYAVRIQEIVSRQQRLGLRTAGRKQA